MSGATETSDRRAMIGDPPSDEPVFTWMPIKHVVEVAYFDCSVCSLRTACSVKNLLHFTGQHFNKLLERSIAGVLAE